MRCCDHPDCDLEGEFRAPKSQSELRDYYWFCLEHVREYNARWNYCEGMDTSDIEQEVRKDSCWQRPTWPMGSQGAHRREQFDIRDEFDFCADISRKRRHENNTRSRQEKKAAKQRNPELEALRLLGLDARASLTELKARYKELVKRLHPDLNGGDSEAENRLKGINEAYSILKKSLA